MNGPTLDQYPGYYPAGSKPFWSRAKVGVVAGVAGLLIGLAGTTGSDAEVPPEASSATEIADLQTELDEALAANEHLSDELTSDRAEAATAASDASRVAKRAQKKAVHAAIARTRRAEQKKAAAAVAAAKREAAAASVPTSAVAPLAAPASSTDPQYSYCYEANDAGFGPYYQGQDPEYDWYDDADGDGAVCEY